MRNRIDAPATGLAVLAIFGLQLAYLALLAFVVVKVVQCAL